MFETVAGTTRHLVNVPEIPFAIEFFRLSDELYDRERFSRRTRRPVTPLGREAWMLTPEDVIVTKVRWAERAARGKDADDIRDVATVQGDTLDWPYIHRWRREHKTSGTLRAILERLPPDLRPAGVLSDD